MGLTNRVNAQENTIKPPSLTSGMGVGLISPAGATFLPEKIEVVQDAMKALGLVPYLAPHILARYGYLAGKDEERAADVNQFFADPRINLILPIRGDWGCSRILPYLDYNLIKQNPKIIIGFSDLTALLLAITAKTGLITFHGPNGLTAWRPQQTASFKDVLWQGKAPLFQNTPHPEDSDRLMAVKNRIRTITSGKARGKIFGGNLSVFVTLVGSSYLPNLKGAILFLEDVGEDVYRIDRMLTHLKLAGIFEQISGFIWGQCTNCPANSTYGSLTLDEILRDHLVPLKIPAYSGAMIGHLEPILTFPMGIEVEMDSDKGQIRYLEAGVRS
ncbi:MAG: LD-carboxypeptidase [Microcystaceae cyanobacterium]